MKIFFRIHKGHLAFVHDLVMSAIAFHLTLWLRLGSDIITLWGGSRLFFETILFVCVAGVVFIWQKLYRGIWRYSSTQDLLALIRSSTLTNLLYLPILFTFDRLINFPRSFLVINWFILILMLGIGRFFFRIYRERRQDTKNNIQDMRSIPVLLIGANDTAELFIRTTKTKKNHYHAVGIVAQTKTKVGRDIHSVPILGTFEDIKKIVSHLALKKLSPEKLIITDDSISGSILRNLLDQAETMGMTLARLPKITDFQEAENNEVNLRSIAIEDLLGRPQNILDRTSMASLIENRKIVVTGAGGSIGGELVRQIAVFKPKFIVLLELSEYALYSIELEIREKHPDIVCYPVIADIRNRHLIDKIFSGYQPELVFHAAALKHVPIVECNPIEGLYTNAIGTRIVADSCCHHKVSLMVLISSDKAVNPTSIMGGAKRIAESYCQALDLEGHYDSSIHFTRFVTVRFGNVLGSTGSVVPLFQRQLLSGGPLTVTHPEMTRYFMTIREAVELILQASAFAFSHPQDYQGRIFVLDMGEPVKIVNLAKQMIRLAGLRPDQDIAIDFTGLRPGEKLFEEIFHGAESPIPTEIDGILIASIRAGDLSKIKNCLDDLEKACQSQQVDKALEILYNLVPEFQLKINK